eukprot:CAMPEP_0172826094 /NCGR_PEP_ID=MMETSP1075-20121228/19169_1 /TAXON_ID=2916 /ORGANISM="Ceratium fusus, Strain PA161109" /LENGTH=44 /DNA_ID= /DNA_START= /DNA_END= /DNA_ORIENTATION=
MTRTAPAGDRKRNFAARNRGEAQALRPDVRRDEASACGCKASTH